MENIYYIIIPIAVVLIGWLLTTFIFPIISGRNLKGKKKNSDINYYRNYAVFLSVSSIFALVFTVAVVCMFSVLYINETKETINQIVLCEILISFLVFYILVWIYVDTRIKKRLQPKKIGSKGIDILYDILIYGILAYNELFSL